MKEEQKFSGSLETTSSTERGPGLQVHVFFLKAIYNIISLLDLLLNHHISLLCFFLFKFSSKCVVMFLRIPFCLLI